MAREQIYAGFLLIIIIVISVNSIADILNHHTKFSNRVQPPNLLDVNRYSDTIKIWSYEFVVHSSSMNNEL